MENTPALVEASPTPAPPKHFGKAGRQYWAACQRNFDIEPDQRPLLQVACEALDTMGLCRRRCKVDGRFITNSKGVTILHPAASEWRAAADLFIRARRELGLDIDVPESPRGPASKNFRGDF